MASTLHVFGLTTSDRVVTRGSIGVAMEFYLRQTCEINVLWGVTDSIMRGNCHSDKEI